MEGMPLEISIHAPREGSDYNRILERCAPVISIHAPREGSDPGIPVSLQPHGQFQSTLPVRGAT